MSWEYSCPTCHSMLNPGTMVILIASHEETRAMIGMHPKPGKYDIYLPPGVVTENGDKWGFACPICHESLQTREDPNLCELVLKVDGDPLRILFSRIAGEHATFIVHADTMNLKEQHGEDASRYSSLWNRVKAMRN
jgi:hypothetical protein